METSGRIILDIEDKGLFEQPTSPTVGGIVIVGGEIDRIGPNQPRHAGPG